MRLAKTDKARDALGAGKIGAIDLRDRQVLILADGKRARAELISMLGAERMGSIDRLMREGFLADADRAPVIAPVAVPAAPPPSAKRRSLASAKMYLIDMLQLQRSATAAELRLSIQATSDQGLLLDRLIEALGYLLSSTPPTYGERVLARFSEVVPEDALPRLPALV